MKKILTILVYCCILIMLTCCGQESLKNPIYNTTVFKGQRGETEVNSFNKNRAEREKLLAETIEKADEAKRKLINQPGSPRKNISNPVVLAIK